MDAANDLVYFLRCYFLLTNFLQWLSEYGPLAFSQPWPSAVCAHTCLPSTLLRHWYQGAGSAASWAHRHASRIRASNFEKERISNAEHSLLVAQVKYGTHAAPQAAAARPGATSGSTSVNLAPAPTSLCSSMRPPRTAVTMLWATCRPRPEPPDPIRVVKNGS